MMSATCNGAKQRARDQSRHYYSSLAPVYERQSRVPEALVELTKGARHRGYTGRNGPWQCAMQNELVWIERHCASPGPSTGALDLLTAPGYRATRAEAWLLRIHNETEQAFFQNGEREQQQAPRERNINAPKPRR